MSKTVQTIGLVLALMGVSGTIDHLAYQPIMGPFLNFFNRTVFPRVDLLAGYELYANLVLAAFGVVVLVAADRFAPA